MRYARLLLLALFVLSLTVPALALAQAADGDGDGIPDNLDRCPGLPANNSGYPVDSDYYGCPDRDMDGFPDHMDACPDTYVDPASGSTNGCPVQPAPDTDGDGIPDNLDQCPLEAANGSAFPPGSLYYGCPDRDGDGVADSVDVCPDTYADPTRSDPTRPGCPAEQCIIGFAGSQTLVWPSYRAPVKNPAATPGMYSATARTRDNLWWLLQGTDWVQGVATTPGACASIRIYEPIPDANCGPVVGHIVQRGETLSSIARLYGMALGPIVTANRIENPNNIEVGATLIIPCPVPATPVPPPPPATPTPTPFALTDEPGLALPELAITTATVAGVGQLFVREFIGFPYDLNLFSSGLEETLSFVTDAGLVEFYSLVAPETMPGALAGTDQSIYQFAATRDEVLAAVELDAAGGSSTVRVEGLMGLRDNRLDLPIPIAQGVSVTDFALTPDLLITTSGALTGPDDATGVRIWGLTEAVGTEIAFIPHPAPVVGVAVSPDYTRLVSAALDGAVRVFDLTATPPLLLASLSDGPQSIAAFNGGSSLAFSPDNRLLAVGGSDGFARIWTIDSGELLARLPHGAGSQVLSAAFSPDGSVLATAGGIHPATEGGPFLFQDTTIYLWDVAALQDGEGALAVRPAGPWKLEGHLDAVTGLAFSASGNVLVSLSADGSFRLWGVTDARS